MEEQRVIRFCVLDEPPHGVDDVRARWPLTRILAIIR